MANITKIKLNNVTYDLKSRETLIVNCTPTGTDNEGYSYSMNKSVGEIYDATQDGKEVLLALAVDATTIAYGLVNYSFYNSDQSWYEIGAVIIRKGTDYNQTLNYYIKAVGDYSDTTLWLYAYNDFVDSLSITCTSSETYSEPTAGQTNTFTFTTTSSDASKLYAFESHGETVIYHFGNFFNNTGYKQLILIASSSTGGNNDDTIICSLALQTTNGILVFNLKHVLDVSITLTVTNLGNPIQQSQLIAPNPRISNWSSSTTSSLSFSSTSVNLSGSFTPAGTIDITDPTHGHSILFSISTRGGEPSPVPDLDTNFSYIQAATFTSGTTPIDTIGAPTISTSTQINALTSVGVTVNLSYSYNSSSQTLYLGTGTSTITLSTNVTSSTSKAYNAFTLAQGAITRGTAPKMSTTKKYVFGIIESANTGLTSTNVTFSGTSSSVSVSGTYDKAKSVTYSVPNQLAINGSTVSST